MDKLVTHARLRVHAGIPDSAPATDLEHRDMARELIHLRWIMGKAFALINSPEYHSFINISSMWKER